MIELFIENKKIDITDDLEINFTYESIDPDKLSSIKNSFSKTVNIPGTPNNNITFGHIFRFDKYIPVSGPSNIDSYYDPHKRVEWFINKNGSLVNRGYCTLDNIIVKNERDITYQLTLYGGIGEFFYSLSYNSDGYPKTLKDLYWNWYPRINEISHGSQTTPGNENEVNLYKCSASVIAESYHKLNPLYTYSGTTEIERDIVFIPAYTGLYEDFDSKHMLVSTFNHTNYTPNPPVISSDTRNKLQESFPDVDPDDSNYTALGNTLSSSDVYRYGLVSFSRDIDPWEAGDLRVSELPIAVRLSKMMEVISQAQNNGGYEVIWDSEILHSYEHLYSWVLLGKLKQDREKISILSFTPSANYDGQKSEVAVEYSTGDSSLDTATQDYNLNTTSTIIDKGTYSFSLNVIPKFSININTEDFKTLSELLGFVYGCYYNWNNRFDYIYNTSVLIHKIYSGNTLLKTICDIFYYTTNTELFKFGYNTNNTTDRFIKASLENKITEVYMNSGETIDQFTYHNCKLENPDINSSVNYECSSEEIKTLLNISSDINDFRIYQIQSSMWTRLKYDEEESYGYRITSGVYGTDSLIYNTTDYNNWGNIILSRQGLIGFFIGSNDNSVSIKDYSEQKCSVDTSFNLNITQQNGILNTKSTGFNIINLNKATLFADSESPMKYLAGYCKLMNYKFICDSTNKKIYIKTLKNYYQSNNIVDLDYRVDLGRNIEIKNITTNYKTINIGLDTPETYPVYIFNKTSKNKFNTIHYNTGIDYNIGETNLFKDLVYKNTIDWQQSSIYYNTHPQFPRPYSTPSISWTLFNKDATTDEVKKKELITPGIPSSPLNLSENIDFLPKISLFNKENKITNIGASLIFLNGFVKNYDYTEIPNTTYITLTPDSTNPSHFINSSGVVASSQYQDIYIYNYQPNTRYFITASFNSNYISYVVNYYNAEEVRIGTEYTQANSNLVDAELLNIPSNTATIRCNFRKSDTNAKLKALGRTFVISPRVSFSNDMYEQFYLNQARCYMYDFKYNEIFTSWGCYSSDQKSTASSWILPLFSRDLYNLYLSGRDVWWGAEYKLSSWNIINQEGLDSLCNLDNTKFISNTDYDYTKFAISEDYLNNEYSINNFPLDEESYTNRIYDKNWKDYLGDLYDRNTRDVVAYVDLSGLGDANSVMRKIYSWKSHLWIITKLENFKLSETTRDKFTKVRLHKIKDLDTWTN